MLRQVGFSDLEYANKKGRTGRELFLAEMDAVVPWPELLAVVEPHYPRGARSSADGPKNHTGQRNNTPLDLGSRLACRARFRGASTIRELCLGCRSQTRR